MAFIYIQPGKSIDNSCVELFSRTVNTDQHKWDLHSFE